MKHGVRPVVILWAFLPIVLAQQESRLHGLKSLRVLKIENAPRLDGILDEEAWKEAEPTDGFVQKDPREGQPASEKTAVRVLYDAKHLYIGVRCFETQVDGILARELRRDNNFHNDDTFAVILDSFHDHRNSFLFRINPKGTQYDALITEEGRDVNVNWDEKWEVETQAGEEGWSAEIKIPFSSIRFSFTENNQDFGIDFERVIRRKNEFTYWNNYSRNFSFQQVSQAGHLVGLEKVETGLRVRVKPYVNTRVLTRGQEQRNTSFLGDVGLEDLKYRITPGLTLDLTANTDFAQTEVDDQIINFDRVPIFFPEKREFFLEGAGIFEFGILRAEGREPEATLYHSRRIGLSEEGRAIPILAGAKLTGKLGEKFTLGLLEAQTDDHQGRPGDNFAVFRLKRDLFSRSSAGFFFTHRRAKGGDYSRVIGVDQNLIFLQYLKITGMLARSFNDDVKGDQWIGGIGGGWDDDFLTTGFDYAVIQKDFASDLAFVERVGVQRYSPHIRISPRPRSRKIRQLTFNLRYDHYRNMETGRLETEVYHLNVLGVTFQDGSAIRPSPHHRVENLDQPLRLSRGLVVPPGRYSWWYFPITYSLNPARKIAGSFQYRYEKDYFGKGGRRQTWALNPVFKFSSRLSADIDYSINRIRLPGGNPVNVHLMNNRFNVALSRKWLTSTLFQYSNSRDLIGVNFRLNYIYRPGDDLFIVFNEFRRRNGAAPDDLDRSIIVKFTHSFDF